jgi:8-oxo-dGTP diphosphatase
VGDVFLVTGHLIIPDDAPDDLIRAAGGVITRIVSGRLEIATIYREARGDWTFPKGKLEPGETFELAALRETWEETGMWCEIVRFIGTTNYTHRKGKPKIVAYYLMRAAGGEFQANEEVDELIWLSVDEVRERLTWDRDQELFDMVLELLEVNELAS